MTLDGKPEFNEDDEPLELGADQPEAEEPEDDAAEDDEVGSVVTLGDDPIVEEEAEAAAPEWVRDLRRVAREDKKKRRELEAELAAMKAAPIVQEEPIGEKPTLQGAAYDTDAFEAQLLEWNERKRKHEAKAEAAKAQAKVQQEQWQARQTAYQAEKKALRLVDFDDAEDAVKDTFDVTQQGIIVHGAKNSAAIIYAIGKNKAEATRLAAIKDPVRFAMEIGKLEDKVKVTPRKPQTAPEGKLNGTAPVSVGNRNLEAARKRASETGDYSEVVRIKAQMAKK